jgi:molybdate transport system substrate-binding protein
MNSVAARAAVSVALAVPLLAGTKQAGAEEIQVLSAASMQTVLNEIIGAFERTSGHKLIIRYSTMGAVTERVIGGEEADLIISSPTSISTLAARGKINVGSEVAIARTGIGIVVASGEPRSRVESIEDFKRALLAAKVIVYGWWGRCWRLHSTCDRQPRPSRTVETQDKIRSRRRCDGSHAC